MSPLPRETSSNVSSRPRRPDRTFCDEFPKVRPAIGLAAGAMVRPSLRPTMQLWLRDGRVCIKSAKPMMNVTETIDVQKRDVGKFASPHLTEAQRAGQARPPGRSPIYWVNAYRPATCLAEARQYASKETATLSYATKTQTWAVL